MRIVRSHRFVSAVSPFADEFLAQNHRFASHLSILHAFRFLIGLYAENNQISIMKSFLSFILFLAFSWGSVFAAYQNISWQNMAPTGNDIHDVAAGANASLFLLVGENGTIATAPDAVTWQFRASNTKADLYGCAIGAVALVAVGSGGTIAYSTDGIVWALVNEQTANFKDVTYGGGIYVAVGELDGSAYIVTSTDGLTWFFRASGLDEPLNSVTYLNGTFLAVGDKGAVTYSLNASIWTPVAAFTDQDLVSVAAGASRFIAVGKATEGERIFSSPGGKNWSSMSAPANADGLSLNGVGYYPGTYTITANQGKILTSSTASTWTTRQLREGYNGDYLANTGTPSTGSNVVGRGGAIYRSLNGLIDWTQYSQGAQGEYKDIVEGGGYSVVVGDDGRIGSSNDNVNWVNRTSNTDKHLRGVTYNGEWWIAVGEQAAILASNNAASQWITRTSPQQLDFYCIAYGNGRYTVGGQDGSILTTTNANGTGWTPVSSGTAQDIVVLEYLNGIFLGGNTEGSILRSQDGTIWRLALGATVGEVAGLAWFDDKYWALSQDNEGNNYLYSSTDGTGWNLVHTQGNASLNTLTADSTWLVATSPEGNVLSTSDGVNWDYDEASLSPGMQALIPYSNGGFLSTGNWAKVAQVYVGIAFETYFGTLTATGNGWWESSWLGFFNGLNYPIIYQEDQGFWICSGEGMKNGANSFWFYDYILGWVWTANGNYPWIYVNARQSWAYYAHNDANFRWFYFQSSGLWESMPISQ